MGLDARRRPAWTNVRKFAGRADSAEPGAVATPLIPVSHMPDGSIIQRESSVMSRSNQRLSVPAAVTVIAVGVIALIASGVLRPSPVSGTPPSSPSAPAWIPSVPPAQPSAPPATPVPARPAPSLDDFTDGSKSVKLDIATAHDLFIEVKDFTGRVVDARTGRAGDGMSVRWSTLKVENLDDDTLRLTWVGLPSDAPVKVVLMDDPAGNATLQPTIVLMQAMPPSDSDALGFDRVLDLDFDQPVLSSDFKTLVQDGYDTGN